MKTELSVNVDHVATLREARGGVDPDPARAAALALDAGASGITIHLREDRRHIQDEDARKLLALRRGVLNLEMALTEEMIGIALALRPGRVTLVPERRLELTTERGLDLRRDSARLREGIARIVSAGMSVSLFLDPEEDLIRAAPETGATIIEIHTGAYAGARGADAVAAELERIGKAARLAESLGITPHAGHGLNVANVGALLRRFPFHELSIGHAIVARAIEVGMGVAVREMIDAMRAA